MESAKPNLIMATVNGVIVVKMSDAFCYHYSPLK